MKDGFTIVSDEESLIQKRQRKQEELGKPGVPQWKRLRLNGEIAALNIQIDQVDMPTHVFKEDRVEEPEEITKTALEKQVGGDHYKDMAIQPVWFIHANNIPFIDGCVIKYVCRHRVKGGKADIEKAIHFLEMILELEYNHKGE